MYRRYCWAINWVPFAAAEGDVPLLLPLPLAGDTSMNTTAAATRWPVRSPQTYIESLALGEVVDLILINPSRMVHPMHIHGSRFWVLASGNLDDAGAAVTGPDGGVDETRLDLDGPPLRDTHAVPQATGGSDGMSGGGGASDGGMGGGGGGGMSGGSGMARGGAGDKPLSYGYSVLRFVASYPGIWPFHCHTALHAESGMAMVFQVGEGAGRMAGSSGDTGDDDGPLGSSEPLDPRFWVLPGGAITCGLQKGGAGGGGGSADKGSPSWGAMLMVVAGIALAVAVLAGIGAYYQRRRMKWLEGRGILKGDDDEAVASQEHQLLLSVVLGGTDGTTTQTHHQDKSNKAAPGGPTEDGSCGDEAGAMEAGRPHRSGGDVMLTQTFWSRDASGGSGSRGGGRGTPQSPLWQP